MCGREIAPLYGNYPVRFRSVGMILNIPYGILEVSRTPRRLTNPLVAGFTLLADCKSILLPFSRIQNLEDSIGTALDVSAHQR